MKRTKLKRRNMKWHLPKWAVGFPTPVSRSINLAEKDYLGLRSLHRFCVVCLLPIARNQQRRVFVYDLLHDINVVMQMSPLERLASAAGR
jgi:hypothetical protein